MTPPNKLYMASPGSPRISIEDESGSVTMLTHHVEHSPDGYAWGYGGSGPAELAKDLLWDHFGQRPSSEIYHDFLEDQIATIPTKAPFEMTTEHIDGWVMSWRAQQPSVPTVDSDRVFD